MSKRSKPQLTQLQQRRVQAARRVAHSTAKEIADDYQHVSSIGPSPFAFGVAQQTVSELLGIIAELADEHAPTEAKRTGTPACGQHSDRLSAACTRPAGHKGGHRDDAKDAYWPQDEEG